MIWAGWDEICKLSLRQMGRICRFGLSGPDPKFQFSGFCCHLSCCAVVHVDGLFSQSPAGHSF